MLAVIVLVSLRKNTFEDSVYSQRGEEETKDQTLQWPERIKGTKSSFLEDINSLNH